MRKSIVATSMKYCMVCGRPAEHIHHLICGTANRKNSEAAGLLAPLCEEHHREIHEGVNGSYFWSHALAEMAWIHDNQLPYEDREAVIERFIDKFGKNYL